MNRIWGLTARWPSFLTNVSLFYYCISFYYYKMLLYLAFRVKLFIHTCVGASKCHPALRRHISRIVAEIPQHYDKHDKADLYSVASHPPAIVSPFYFAIIHKIFWQKERILFRNKKYKTIWKWRLRGPRFFPVPLAILNYFVIIFLKIILNCHPPWRSCSIPGYTNPEIMNLLPSYQFLCTWNKIMHIVLQGLFAAHSLVVGINNQYLFSGR